MRSWTLRLCKIPPFIPGRDPSDRLQPGGGQVLQPYWSWQGETFLQMMMVMMIQPAWLSAKLVFVRPVGGGFGWRAFQQQLPVLCVLKPPRAWMSYLAGLELHNKQLMMVCQPLLIPSPTVWSRISFAPFSQVKCSPRSLINTRFIPPRPSPSPGQVYYISKCSLKIANKQYTSVKNDYEMTLNGESTVIPCEDNCDVPRVQCDFISIGDLESKEKDSIVGKEVREGRRWKTGAEERFVTTSGVLSSWRGERGCGRLLHLVVFVPAPGIFLINHFLYWAELLFIPAPGRVLNKDQRLSHQDLSLRHQAFIVALGLSPWIRLCEPFQGQFQACASFFFFFFCWSQNEPSSTSFILLWLVVECFSAIQFFLRNWDATVAMLVDF